MEIIQKCHSGVQSSFSIHANNWSNVIAYSRESSIAMWTFTFSEERRPLDTFTSSSGCTDGSRGWIHSLSFCLIPSLSFLSFSILAFASSLCFSWTCAASPLFPLISLRSWSNFPQTWRLSAQTFVVSGFRVVPMTQQLAYWERDTFSRPAAGILILTLLRERWPSPPRSPPQWLSARGPHSYH